MWKQATDRWADGALSDLLEVEYHHVVLSAPCQLRGVMAFNREVCLSILARAATACFNQWARDQHGMRMGLVTVIHTFGSDLKWHPHLHLLVTEGGLSLEQVLLIACPMCGEGLQIPTLYQTHTGHDVRFDPDHPENAVIHAS